MPQQCCEASVKPINDTGVKRQLQNIELELNDGYVLFQTWYRL